MKKILSIKWVVAPGLWSSAYLIVLHPTYRKNEHMLQHPRNIVLLGDMENDGLRDENIHFPEYFAIFEN